jgi:acetyltransferase (GNAT) family protein
MTRSTTGWLSRRARPADASALGALHVRSWRHAYRGLVPDGMLATLDPAESSARWHDWLNRPDGPEIFVAIRRHPSGAERVGAFSAVGPVRGEPGAGRVPRCWGELYALYADPDVYGSGAGHTAHEAGLNRLAERGVGGALLWVLAANTRGRAFYVRHGWSYDDVTERYDVRGVALEVVRYSREPPS